MGAAKGRPARQDVNSRQILSWALDHLVGGRSEPSSPSVASRCVLSFGYMFYLDAEG
jgi:hypothetical protein